MLYEPSLIVTRVSINRGDHVVYDEPFHRGVNVIRGENSSGKSTILNSIFYGLGGDLSEWSEVALLCTHVTLEVMLNGKAATLRREIAESGGQPMMVYGGAYELARAAPIDEWKKYPYRRSASLESFSQALFRLLGIPEVASDEAGNVTMHQVLRLLYADQLSPVESLFRFERFDPPTLRDAVGRLLAGAYDPAIYANELEIRALSREFDAVSGELRSLFSVLGRADLAGGFEWVRERRAALELEREQLVSATEQLERQLFELGASDELTLKAQQDVYGRVQSIQQRLGELELERDTLNFTIADSNAFIASLEAKITSLSDSGLAAAHVGEIRFSTCPACYAEIVEPEDESIHVCHLCRTPFDSERSRSRIVSLINEAGVQLKQSRLLQERRMQNLEQLGSQIDILRGQWREASRQLAEAQRLPSTDTQEQLRATNRRAGYVDREIENLLAQERVVELIAELGARKDDLSDRITRLRSQIEGAKFMQQKRFDQAYAAIEVEILDLLRHDLRRQDSFENPQRVEFDFASNRISVDGHTYFSASSRVVLKSSFFLAFLAAATKDPNFRHPRFVMIDTIEDKGMEPERSHNFQNQILRKSKNAVSEHQIIYATAMISPELDDEEYIVGKFSTRDDPTLDIRL